MRPVVSVLMAVHNGEAFLCQTLVSISQQTLGDYEFVIVDDSSSDSTPQLLAAASAEDARIKIIRNDKNLGLTRSLNVGLAAANGKYIARIDADDLAEPRRLEEQALFLDEHNDHILVGARERVIDSEGRFLRTGRGALSSFSFRYLSFFAPPITHSSAFFRKSTLVEFGLKYNEDCRTAQDFELWQRMQAHGKGHRLSNVLVQLREHEASISRVRKGEQGLTAISASTRALLKAFPEVGRQKLEGLAEFVIAGRVRERGGVDEIVSAAFEVEERFIRLSSCPKSEGSIIHGLTVNLLLKGAANSENQGMADVREMALRLLRKRPITTAKELSAIALRR